MSPLRCIEMYGARARFPIPSSLISMIGLFKIFVPSLIPSSLPFYITIAFKSYIPLTFLVRMFLYFALNNGEYKNRTGDEASAACMYSNRSSAGCNRPWMLVTPAPDPPPPPPTIIMRPGRGPSLACHDEILLIYYVMARKTANPVPRPKLVSIAMHSGLGTRLPHPMATSLYIPFLRY